jgi:hypothetical protein
VKVIAGSPPTVALAWCSGPNTNASPVVSMTDAAGTNAMVWVVGTDNKLYALEGNGTGLVLYGSADTIIGVQKFQSPIIVKGRIFIPTADRLYAFTSI